MDRVKHLLEGHVSGVRVRVEFVEDEVSDMTLHATEVHVPYAPGTPRIAFNIRWGQPHFEQHLREGLHRDILIGDPEFDGEYLVDAAPADVVQELLDAPTRARLLGGRYRLFTQVETLMLEKNEWVEDLDSLADMVDFALDLAARLAPAAQAAREKQRHATGGEAYRSLRTDDEIDADRAAEVAALLATDARRRQIVGKRQARGSLLVTTLIAAVVLGLAYAMTR